VDQVARLRLAKVLKKARGTLSQHKFAEQLGVSQTSIQRWEKGKGTVTLENLERLAYCCGYRPEELIALVYGRELQTRPLEAIVQDMPIEMLSFVLAAASHRLRELTAAEHVPEIASAEIELTESKD
jgi:transcriptional regulator with XRE-family HTH domain